MKSNYVCSNPECAIDFKRWPSTVRNPDKVYCSLACKGKHSRGENAGSKNPNYKDGRACDPSYCSCGVEKDVRSILCAKCAGRGYSRHNKKSLEEIFSLGDARNGYVRKLVIQHNLIPYECSGCEWWVNWPNISLDLDHISGDPADNRLENLRFLCPNCHRQTNTWGSKNIKKRVDSVAEVG